MKKSRLLLIFVSALTSCGTALKYIPLEQAYNDEWVGRKYVEIVGEFGAPDRVESDGLDGKILVYEDVTTVTKTDVNHHVNTRFPDYTTTVRNEKEYKHFFLGNDNVCYRVKSNEIEVDQASVKRSKTAFWLSTGLGIGAVFLLTAVMAG